MIFQQEELESGTVIDHHLVLADNGVTTIAVAHDCRLPELSILGFPDCTSNQIFTVLTELLDSYRGHSKVESLAFTLNYSQDYVLSDNFARFSISKEAGLTVDEALKCTPLGTAAMQLGFSRISAPIVNDRTAHVRFYKE